MNATDQPQKQMTEGQLFQLINILHCRSVGTDDAQLLIQGRLVAFLEAVQKGKLPEDLDDLRRLFHLPIRHDFFSSGESRIFSALSFSQSDLEKILIIDDPTAFVSSFGDVVSPPAEATNVFFNRVYSKDVVTDQYMLEELDRLDRVPCSLGVVFEAVTNKEYHPLFLEKTSRFIFYVRGVEQIYRVCVKRGEVRWHLSFEQLNEKIWNDLDSTFVYSVRTSSRPV